MSAAGAPPALPWHPLRQTAEWVRRPERTADQLLRRCGDAFTLKAFGADLALHARPDLIQEICSQPADVLAAGRSNAILAPVVGDASLLLLDGEEHLATRRLLLPSMHRERLRRYELRMTQIAEAKIARWPLERAFASWPRMQSITLDVIIDVVFGITAEREATAVRAAVRELLRTGAQRRRLAAAAVWTSVTGRRGSAPSAVLRAVMAARSRLGALLEREITRRRAQEGEAPGDDVLAMLLEATDESGAPLPTELLRDQLITMLVAGHETTATSLSWAIERIARHPDLQEQLAIEALDGRHELIDATVKETLRQRPVLPIFLREVLEPCTIGGRDYAPGDLVGGATLALHRHPDVYPEPLAFRPSRFLGPDAPGTYAWTPFGGGIRRCIGASFALLEMRVILSALLAERRLEPVDPEDERTRRRSIVLTPARGGVIRAPRRRAKLAEASAGTRSGVR